MRVFDSFRNPAIALLWAGLSMSALGDQLYAVAVAWIAVGVLGPHAGYLTALNAAVVLLTVLGIGRWADAWGQRGSMIVADLVRAATLGGLVVAWFAAGGPSAALLVGAVVVLALGQAVFQPALQAVLPGVVAERQLLPAANGLLDATDRSARLLGPGLVGLLAGVIPVVHFFTIDAVSFVVSAAALLWIGRWRPVMPRPLPKQPVWSSILRGVRAMRSHPILGYVLATTGFVNGAWYAVFYLGLPLLIERRGVVGPGFTAAGGSGLGAYGLVISAYGCTNLAATLVFGSRTLPARPQFQMFGGTIIVGAGMVLLGFAGTLPSAWLLPAFIVTAALSAIGGPMKDIPMAVLRQTRLQPGDMAAAMRAYMAMTSAGTLAAMLIAPSIIEATGVVPVIVASGMVLVVLAGAGMARLADWTEPAPA